VTKKDGFPKGMVVTVNEAGAKQFPTLTGKSGTVVGLSRYSTCVRVKWEHLKIPHTIRVSLLETL
jgi:hypothetical protein